MIPNLLIKIRDKGVATTTIIKEIKKGKKIISYIYVIRLTVLRIKRKDKKAIRTLAIASIREIICDFL